jgi:hypothetical protein
MKKLTCIYSITALLFIAIMVISGCKKDTVTTDPTFNVTATTVQLQGGGEGLQFFAKSTNVDVKMTSVVIVDPNNTPPFPYTYNFNGAEFSTNQSFGLQENNVAYGKVIGTWKFTFTGSRTSDDGAFAVEATLAVNN